MTTMGIILSRKVSFNKAFNRHNFVWISFVLGVDDKCLIIMKLAVVVTIDVISERVS